MLKLRSSDGVVIPNGDLMNQFARKQISMKQIISILFWYLVMTCLHREAFLCSLFSLAEFLDTQTCFNFCDRFAFTLSTRLIPDVHFAQEEAEREWLPRGCCARRTGAASAPCCTASRAESPTRRSCSAHRSDLQQATSQSHPSVESTRCDSPLPFTGREKRKTVDSNTGKSTALSFPIEAKIPTVANGSNFN